MPRNLRLSLSLQSSGPKPSFLLLLLLSLLSLSVSIGEAAAIYSHTQTTWPLICHGPVPIGETYNANDFTNLLSFCGDHGVDNHPAADCSCVFPVNEDYYYDSYDEKKEEGKEEDRRNLGGGAKATVSCEGDARLKLRWSEDSESVSGKPGGASMDFCQKNCFCPGHPAYPNPYPGGGGGSGFVSDGL